MKNFCTFFSSDLHLAIKVRILVGYYFLSRNKSINILGIRIRYSPDTKNHSLLILKEIFINRIYTFTEPVDVKLKAGKPSTIIDVGANVGIAVAYFRQRYPDTRIIAIEASPINYEYLSLNIKNNNIQNIKTINAFCSNVNSSTDFYHNFDKPGGSFGKGFKSQPKNSKQFLIDTKKLSQIISDYNNIVIKIDVEGAEYLILEDLSTSKNLSEVLEITAEVSVRSLRDYEKLLEIISVFSALGFESRLICDYSVNFLKNKSKQDHLQLILLRQEL
jgi:FkbM family methyltransferase